MFSSFVNRCLLGLLCALMLSGCSMLSPYSDMTKVDLTLQGSERLNPDINDRPSPIVLQLIELKNPVAFEHADFFSLYQRPREVLAPDLVAMEELELRPGEERTYKLSAQPESRYLAVLAAYRDLPQAQWCSRWIVRSAMKWSCCWMNRVFASLIPTRMRIEA